MRPADYYRDRLERQRASIRSAILDLQEAQRASWRVLQAELELDSRVRSYVRDLEDAPASVVASHAHMCVCFT